ncbi:MAG: FAD-dependent oxidoreductase [Longicatena sp.]
MKNSYWIEKSKNKKSFPRIEKEMDANIVIVGAGLTGLSTAYYLGKATNDVFLIEANQICYGASGRNNGKVSAQHGLLYKDMIKNYDIVLAKQYYEANNAALNSIEEIINKHHIACDFKRCDTSIYTQDATKIGELQDEYQAYLDLHIPCNYTNTPSQPFPMEACLSMHYQATFDPYAYGLALSEIVVEEDISIFENSPVETMIEEEDGTYTLLVNHQKVHANKVIFTSQFPFIDHGHLYFTKMVCEQESVLCGKSKIDLPNTLLNIEQPVHSFTLNQDYLLLGGNNHKSSHIDEKNEASFVQHALDYMEAIDYEWSSQDYVTFDKIPFIGKLDKHNENVLFASGFSKWGNTTSNIAGKLLSAIALGQSSPYRMLFSPQRLSHLFSLPYVKENLDIVYTFVKSKFKDSEDEYPCIGEGKTMQIDSHTYGVYRDEQNELFIVDITCPHIGCVCSFNTIDKTWDCPCHGSRFSYKGEIIKGPATHSLRAYGEGLNVMNPHIIE